MNGTDVIEENDRSLSSLGLVNGDLVYALSSNPEQGTSPDKNVLMLSQLIDMGFDKVFDIICLEIDRLFYGLSSISICYIVLLLCNNETLNANMLAVDDNVSNLKQGDFHVGKQIFQSCLTKCQVAVGCCLTLHILCLHEKKQFMI